MSNKTILERRYFFSRRLPIFGAPKVEEDSILINRRKEFVLRLSVLTLVLIFFLPLSI